MLNSIIAVQAPAIYIFIYAAVAVSDCDECGFNDLGKLLFGGVIATIVVGIAISVLHHRIKQKSKEPSAFVSIRSENKK